MLTITQQGESRCRTGDYVRVRNRHLREPAPQLSLPGFNELERGLGEGTATVVRALVEGGVPVARVMALYSCHANTSGAERISSTQTRAR